MLYAKKVLVGNPSLLLLLEYCKSVRQAHQVHAQFITNGLHHDMFSMSKLISFFALSDSKEGLRHSQLLFSQIDSPNTFIWNTMIRGYSRSDSPHEALVLYKAMKAKRIELLNNFTYPFLLNSCVKLRSIKAGFQIHSHVVKYGYEFDLFIRNALIHMYSVLGGLDLAQKLFEECFVKDLVSYNTMINGYAQADQPRAALQVFRDMKDDNNNNIWPDEFTFVALSSACSSLNDPKIGKQIHSLVYKNLSSHNSNVLLKNAIIDMYAKSGMMDMAERVYCSMGTNKSHAAMSSMILGYAKNGEIDRARQFFDDVKERDLVSWTTMITGYSQVGQYSEALELFEQMERLGMKPDEITMVTVLSACARLGALSFGKRIVTRYIENSLFPRNTRLVTAVIDMYAKCGSIDTALEIFHRTGSDLRTVFLFNSMISGLAQHGIGKRAITVFREIDKTGLKPDHISFVAVLSACSHSGLVEEGKELFQSMFKVHGIEPRMEHYGCMVDLLGRDGRLGEARDLIQNMPFEANSVIWRSLLGACKLHRNMEMAETAAKKLRHLEPEHGAHYVLLSNMLANSNQFEEAMRVRKGMEAMGIQKPPGWSHIELDGKLHQFLASDKSHLQGKGIEAMLKDMNMRLKSVGYVPNTSQVVFDIDEEEKETVVSYHSERLALAFGLMNSVEEETVRIMKNLRICGDCHAVFKLLSEIYGREIVVRDAVRFHHFQNGSCSCGDFW